MIRPGYYLLAALIIFFSHTAVHSSTMDSPKNEDVSGSGLVLIQPTPELHNDYPVMELLPDTTALYHSLHNAFNNSYLGQALKLYKLAGEYASQMDTTFSSGPAYLAITKNQGGFAKNGFYLRMGDSLADHTFAPYIDITERAASGELAGLMSLTQLYPHELGHVMYHMLSREDTANYNNRSVDMHYFSMVTDYPTAFNEGFAEHMENVARLMEENDSIRQGIEEDMNRIGALTGFTKKKFRRDLHMPFRLGFYKATMVNWFQKYEDYKRYEHAMNGTIRYRSTTPDFLYPADRITYRNTMLSWDSSMVRNKVQAHATEGMISSFFTSLTMSRLGSVYCDSGFYAAFALGMEESAVSPPEIYSEVENMFMKYFHVFHHYMVSNSSGSSQLIDFIEGYISEFPDEKEAILEIYAQVFGETYSPELPPPLWLLSHDFEHRLLTLDAYGAITVPIYTFDLNAAETEDLITLGVFEKEEAAAIVAYRDLHGMYESFGEIGSVPGIDYEDVENLKQHAFDQALFEETLDGYDAGIGMGKLFAKPLKSISLKILFYLFIFYIAMNIIAFRSGKDRFYKYIPRFIGHYLLWLSAVLTGIFAVMAFQNPVPVILALHAVLIFFTYLVFRKKKENRKFSMLMQASLLFVVVISLF